MLLIYTDNFIQYPSAFFNDAFLYANIIAQMSRNGHLRKEVFTMPLDHEWLSYAWVTQVYREGILTTMYAQGHLKGEKWLWDPFHVALANTENFDEKTLEQKFYALVEESLHKLLTTNKSLPSN